MGQPRIRRSSHSRSCVRYAGPFALLQPLPVSTLAGGVGPVRRASLAHSGLGQLGLVATLLATVALAPPVAFAHAKAGLAPLAGAPKQRQSLAVAPHGPGAGWTRGPPWCDPLVGSARPGPPYTPRFGPGRLPAAGASTGFPQTRAARSPRTPLHASGVEYVGIRPLTGIRPLRGLPQLTGTGAPLGHRIPWNPPPDGLRRSGGGGGYAGSWSKAAWRPSSRYSPDFLCPSRRGSAEAVVHSAGRRCRRRGA
jgi:hypothetical protein